MKLFGHAVDGTPLQAVASAAKKGAAAAARTIQTVAARVRPVKDRDAIAELRRRAEVNARGEAGRAAREASIFGEASWLPRRSHWLERGR